MRVTFSYFAQVRKAAGVESETVTAADGSTALDVLRAIDHGAGFSGLLFAKAGALHPVILLVVNCEPAAPDRVLQDGYSVQIFSPVSGG